MTFFNSSSISPHTSSGLNSSHASVSDHVMNIDRHPLASLGINAKSSPALSERENTGLYGRINLDTGEIESGSKAPDSRVTRLERFALQSVSRSILPKSRTAKCLRIVARGQSVEVWKSSQGGAVYKGLQTCGSVWACPVCAAKISERRRVELLHAIDTHKAGGGDVLLLTLTNPHKLGDDLGEILTKQSAAMSRFNSTRAALKLYQSVGCVGTVRAWEVTHGVNGWHPHFHLLLFVQPGSDLVKLRQAFYSLWANSCRLAGLPVPSERHGVSLEDGSKAAAYASKWGLESEMTKGHIKKAKSIKGRSPFDLLRSKLYDDDRQAAALFQEFARCFHGKRQLVWSKGLKDYFNIQDITDSEIASKVEDTAVKLGDISTDQWRSVLKLDLRGEILELASHGWEPVRRLLDSVFTSPGQDTS